MLGDGNVPEAHLAGALEARMGGFAAALGSSSPSPTYRWWGE